MTYNPQGILATQAAPMTRAPTPSEKEKIRSKISLALLFILIGSLVFVSIGSYVAYDYGRLSTMTEKDRANALGYKKVDYNKSSVETDMQTRLVAASFALTLGVIGLMLMLVIKSKAYTPLMAGEYEDAGRNLKAFGAIGLLFGLVAGGIFLFQAFRLLKESAKKVAPGALAGDMYMGGGGSAGSVKRCSICNTMLQFTPGTQGYWCPQCKKYQ